MKENFQKMKKKNLQISENERKIQKFKKTEEKFRNLENAVKIK